MNSSTKNLTDNMGYWRENKCLRRWKSGKKLTSTTVSSTLCIFSRNSRSSEKGTFKSSCWRRSATKEVWFRTSSLSGIGDSFMYSSWTSLLRRSRVNKRPNTLRSRSRCISWCCIWKLYKRYKMDRLEEQNKTDRYAYHRMLSAQKRFLSYRLWRIQGNMTTT